MAMHALTQTTVYTYIIVIQYNMTFHWDDMTLADIITVMGHGRPWQLYVLWKPLSVVRPSKLASSDLDISEYSNVVYTRVWILAFISHIVAFLYMAALDVILSWIYMTNLHRSVHEINVFSSLHQYTSTTWYTCFLYGLIWLEEHIIHFINAKLFKVKMITLVYIQQCTLAYNSIITTCQQSLSQLNHLVSVEEMTTYICISCHNAYVFIGLIRIDTVRTLHK